MGSGKRLKIAAKKYGKDNFYTEILCNCKSAKEMYLIEKILVVPDQETNYNLCPGGYGGWNKGIPRTEEVKTKLRNANLGRKHSEETLQKLRKNKTEQHRTALRKPKANTVNMLLARQKSASEGLLPWNKGIPHTNQTKDRIKTSIKGLIWITNGIINKKTRLNKSLPEGYYRGRTKY